MPPRQEQFVDELRKQNEEKEFVGETERKIEKVRSELFGVPPNTPEGEFIRKAHARLEANKGYTNLQTRVMFTVRKRLEQIRDLILTEAKARGQTIAETKKAFAHLDSRFTEFVVSTGAALKTIKTPYGKPSETGAAAKNQILEMDEMVLLERFAEELEQINFDEFVNALVENQPMMTVLAEVHAQSGNSIRPKTILSGETDRLDPNNEKYAQNLRELRNFILGRTGQSGVERSANRKTAEAVVWFRIVANLNPAQKRDLLKTFLEEPMPQAAQNANDFIEACIIAGALNKQDVVAIYEHNPDIKAKLGGDEKSFDAMLNRAVKDGEEGRVTIAAVGRQIEKPMARSFVTYYFELDNLIVSRGFDFAFVTAGLNTILNVTDAFRLRPQGQSRIKTVAIGLGNAAKDRYVLAGLGAMAGTSNYVFPWIGDWARSASKDEEKEFMMHQEAQFLQDQVRGHPVVSQYLTEHYSDYLQIAARNELAGKGKEVFPDDIKIDSKDSADMGYRTAEAAKGAVLRMFKICTRDFEPEHLDSAPKLDAFLRKVALAESPLAPKTRKT